MSRPFLHGGLRRRRARVGSMWGFLSEANWELIGVVVALVGVVCSSILGAILYLLQRRRKELGYRVISHTRVVSVEAEVEEEVVISFRGEIVRDVHLVMVEKHIPFPPHNAHCYITEREWNEGRDKKTIEKYG